MSTEKLKTISKFLFSIAVILVLYIFLNNKTYHYIKSLYIPNWQKYVEMKTYLGILPKKVDKYFIVQDNDVARSYLIDVATIKTQEEMSKMDPREGSVWVFESPEEEILGKAQASNAEIIVLNSGEELEFYVAKFDAIIESCQVGG